jgi:hypothetical protein
LLKQALGAESSPGCCVSSDEEVYGGDQEEKLLPGVAVGKAEVLWEDDQDLERSCVHACRNTRMRKPSGKR